jgi:energy-coupling factor transport system ATP-binding protein
VAFSRLAERGVSRGDVPVRLADGLAALLGLPVPAAFSPAEPPPAAGEPPLLKARDVHYQYPDGTAALRGVSLEVRRGEYVVILGQNGAGKSTLIRHFLKLMEPSQGELWIGGQPLAGFTTAQLARRIGYVPQNPDRQIFSATVEEEVAFALRGQPLTPEEKEARIVRALGALGLAGQRRAHPFSLSKGDRARVVIAAVLIMEPEVLVFDEPTTGQDDAGARAILDLTRTLNEAGRTIVVVTHHLALMPPYARRALLLGAGRVLLDAPLRAAYHAVDLLAQTDLRPTQAVALARASRPGNLAITPEEFAATYGSPP